MGVCSSKETIVTVPAKSVMLNIVDRIVALEAKIKKGEHLTRVQELEKKELEKVARSMKAVQRSSMTMARRSRVALPEAPMKTATVT